MMLTKFVLHLVSLSALPATMASPVLAATLNVPADHPTIFEAILFANNGDTILVSPGVYPEQVDFLGKDIVIRSTGGPETTILDGEGQHPVVRFASGEGPGARIEGFTIRNGQGLQDLEAGGIWCYESAPTIVNCVVTGNHGSEPVNNRAGAGGIGSDSASPTILNCLVECNFGGHGSANGGDAGAGGMRLDRAGLPGHTGNGAVIRGCIVRSNRGGDLLGIGHAGAGGVHLSHAIASIEDTQIVDNTGGDVMAPTSSHAGVGGVRCASSAVDLLRCTILSNRGGMDNAPDYSDTGGVGGISFKDWIPTAPSHPSSMVNTVVAWNHAGYGDNRGGTGGVWVRRAWLDIANSAVVGNVAGLTNGVGGLYTQSLSDVLPTTVTNCILWLNEGAGGDADDLDWQRGMPSAPPVLSNLLMGVDPEFVDPSSNDFHLTCVSPAIDTGTDQAPLLPATDFDGDARVIGDQVDIGPDEFLSPGLFPTYCQSNTNSSGVPALVRGVGCLSIAQNEMRIFVDGLPGTPGLLFYGPNQIQVTFGDGFRCVGGATRRLPPMPGMGPAISIDLDLSSLQITPGVQSNFQYWFRDPMAGGAGFSLTNGLEANFAP